MFDFPRLMVEPYARDGDILNLENGNYRIDYNENEKHREFSRELTRRITKFRDI